MSSAKSYTNFSACLIVSSMNGFLCMHERRHTGFIQSQRKGCLYVIYLVLIEMGVVLLDLHCTKYKYIPVFSWKPIEKLCCDGEVMGE